MTTGHNWSERALPTRPNCDTSASRSTLRESERGRRMNGQSLVNAARLILLGGKPLGPR